MPSPKPQNRDAGVPELVTGIPSSSPKGDKHDIEILFIMGHQYNICSKLVVPVWCV